MDKIIAEIFGENNFVEEDCITHTSTMSVAEYYLELVIHRELCNITRKADESEIYLFLIESVAAVTWALGDLGFADDFQPSVKGSFH